MNNRDIEAIRRDLYIEDAFLGCIASSVEWKEDNSQPTAYTNGSRICYNSEFLEKLTSKERVGVIAHECGHIALAHVMRAKFYTGADAQLWNIAADYVINEVLEREGFILPENALRMPLKYSKQNTEYIYTALMNDEEAKKEALAGAKDNALGNDLKPDIETPSEADNNSNNYRAKMVASKANSSKNFGEACEEFTRMFENFLRPKLSWRVLLRNYVNDFKNTNYSWAKPNRRITDFYMPSLCSPEASLNHVNVYIDVSGSIDDTVLNKFFSELNSLYQELSLEHMTVTAFSTCLDTPYIITDPRELSTLKFNSTGGTDIEEVVKDLNDSSALFSIILTDGYYCQNPVDYIKKKVFWVIYDNDNYKPSKGKVAHI